MTLNDLYTESGYTALKLLAEQVGANPEYLRQCATGWRGKRPSPELAARLVAADPRLDFQRLVIGERDQHHTTAAAVPRNHNNTSTPETAP